MKLFPGELPEILHWGRGRANTAPLHVHSFFQLELGIRGRFLGLGAKRCVTIGPGDCHLIAPEEPHGFRELGESFEFISIKFNFPAFRVEPKCDGVTRQLAANLIALLPEQTPPQFTDPARMRLLSGQLYLLLLELSGDAPPPPADPPELLRRISAEVLHDGYRLNVNLLADRLGLTLSQLKYQFRKVNNSASPNLKSHLDSIIIFAAGNHLRYSGLPPGEIARLLNFPDVHTFSRFFKHRTGETPGAFRRRTQG